MLKILYISKKDDVFLKAYIQLLDRSIYDLHLLDLKHFEYTNYNNDHSVKLLNISKINNRSINYLLRFVCASIFLFRCSRDKFDICHILGIKRDNFWIIPWLNKRCQKLLISVYGRSTYTYASKKFLFSYFYKYVDLFAFSNQSLINEFLVANKKIDSARMIKIIPPILNIRRKEEGVPMTGIDLFINKYQIKKDLIKISCSSTVASYDQHDKIINAIKTIKNKDKVQLLFLLTYGGTEAEKIQIINHIKIDLAEFEYVIIDRFLTNEELACYRANTDIYLNMRISDQLAAAIIESLYEGALLISGEWLNYKTFDDIGVYYKTVRNFDELTQCIEESIDDFTNFKQKYAESNIARISKEFSIENISEKWNRIYKDQYHYTL